MAMQDAQWWASAPVVQPAGQPAPQARPAPRRQNAPRRQPAPRIQFADDLDAMTRTIIGEAQGQGDVGMQAVGEVILNRSRKRGQSISDVVTAPYQFEPWGNPETIQRLMSITPDSPDYQSARRIAQMVMDGQTNVTNGADHFYAPSLQAQLGRAKPSFDNGTGRAIGDHLFFNLEGDQAQTAPAQSGGNWWEDAPVADANVVGNTATNARMPDIGNVLKGDAWAPWLTRPGRRVPQGGVETDAEGRTIVNLDTPQIVNHGNGEFEIYDTATEAYYPATASEVAMLERRLAGDLQKRREAEARRDDPAYQAEYEEMRGRAENVPAWLANLGTGGSLGGIQEIIALNGQVLGGDVGAQAARDSWKDRQDTLLAEDPVGTVGMQLAGGLLTPGLKGTGNWIAGASGAARTGRAAVVGGGYSAAAGILGGEGNLGERLQNAPIDAAVGAATGGLLDTALVRATAGREARNLRLLENPSDQRILSRQGIDLTPGQMAGGAVKRIEDGMTSLPILGDSIRDAQRRGLITFDRAATNASLADIGVELADTSGRAGVRAADDAISAAYTNALTGIRLQADEPMEQAIEQALDPAGLTPSIRENLNAVVNNIMTPIREGVVDGETWKQGDSMLAAAIRAADKASASAPEQRLLRDRLQAVRAAYRDRLGRVNADALSQVDNADSAFANYSLVRKASSDVASAGRGGDSSPQTLNRAVTASAGSRRASRGEGLLQELTDPAMRVLPSSVPDSGTPLRGLLSVATLGGGATVAGASPWATALAAGGLLTGAAAYGKTVQNIVNQIYRSTDRQTTTTALEELARFAGRNPAAQPYYQAVAEAVQSAFAGQSQSPEPARAGLLAPTAP